MNKRTSDTTDEKKEYSGVVGSRVVWLAGLHNVLGEVLLEEATFAFQPQF